MTRHAWRTAPVVLCVWMGPIPASCHGGGLSPARAMALMPCAMDVYVHPVAEGMELTWDVWGRMDVIGFSIYRKEGAHGRFEEIARVPGTRYLDRETSAQASYVYRVVARDMQGRGVCAVRYGSAIALTRGHGEDVPAYPTGLRAEGIDAGNRLFWEVDEDPVLAGFRVYLARENGQAYQPVMDTVLPTALLDLEGEPGDVLVRVVGVDIRGAEGPPSRTIQLYFSGSANRAWDSSFAALGLDEAVRLRWIPPDWPDFAGVEIYARAYPNKAFHLIGRSILSGYWDRTVVNGGLYDYYLAAVGTDGGHLAVSEVRTACPRKLPGYFNDRARAQLESMLARWMQPTFDGPSR